MKKIAMAALVFMMNLSAKTFVQQKTIHLEKYGNTLNLGAGLSHYGYVGQPNIGSLCSY